MIPQVNHFKLTLLCLVGFLCFNSNGFGQTPSNNCNTTNANSELTVGASCSTITWNSVNNTHYWDAAASGGCIYATDNDDAWGWFTATSTSTTITYTSNNDAIVSLFTGSCSPTMSDLACADNTTTGNETITYTTVVGVVYMVRIQRYNSSANMNGTICVYNSTPPANPCSSITNIASCGTNTSVAIPSGNGIYNSNTCGFSTPGVERVFSFTPTTSGNYSIQQNSSFGYIDYFYKVAGTCNGTGWTCIDDLSGAVTSLPFALTAGTTYYFMLDPESTAGGNVSFNITCPPTAPSNDSCAGATSLTVNPTSACTTSTSGTTVAATQALSGCTGDADDDVWYSFTATSTAHTITVTSGTISDPVIDLRSGSCNGTSIACMDTTNATEVLNATGLTIGATYYVRVYSYGSGGRGTFNICVTTPVDPCASVTNIASCGTNMNVNVPSGNGIYNQTSCYFGGTPGAEQIFSFTPLVTGSYTLQQNSSFGWIDYFYKPVSAGCSGTGWTCIGAETGSGTSDVFTLSAGISYYIMLDPENTTGGNVNFAINCPPPVPPNDLCMDAINLTCGTNNLAGTTQGSLNATSGLNCGSNYGVWYTFPGDGQQTTISATADFDHELAIASGTNCGAFVDIACIDGPGAGGTESYTFITSPGTTYYVYVSHYSAGSSITGNFTISRTCVPVVIPPNDLCGDAIELLCGDSFPGTTNFTTVTVDNTGCNTSSYGVWYTFEGDGDASTITAVPEAGYNLEISIAAGNCGTFPDTIACVNDNGNGGTESYTFNTTLGVQYYVYIAHNGPASTVTGNFTISRTCAPPSYCIPSSTDNLYFIRDFSTTGGTTNINHPTSGFSAGGYGDFTATHIVTQVSGGVVNFTATHRPNGDTFETNIWVDWNDDFDFDDSNEQVFNSTGYLQTQTGNFTVPGTAPPGSHRMRVRSAYFNTNVPSCGYEDQSETHDYTLIVTPLNCTANPINVVATATSPTTAIISWTAPAPPPGIGYDYVVSTSPTGTPVIASGTTASTSVNVTGLSAQTTYYVFVRGNCNASDQGYWITTTLTTGCSVVVNTPTTCPVIVDVQGNNPFIATPFIADPTAEIDCDMGNVTLVANANLRQTTSYMVEQITYPNPAPLYDFLILGNGNPQVITQDDVWADARSNIGFNFCFYGNTYTQALVGANGMVTFDTANIPGSSCGWQFSNNLPSLANALFEQTIYGVYHDIDPRNQPTDAIKSRTIGSPGCRQFQVAWNDIPMFGDPTRVYTGMIVLHETTNIIEVFIEEKRIENGNVNPWNDGNALVGIQGDITPLAGNGNQYLAAPCRNSLDTNWETTNEAWRFTPNGAAINPLSVTWYQGSVAPGNIIASNPDNSVTVTAGNTYFASVNYNLCSGPVTLVDEIVVTDPRKVWDGSESTNWFVANNWTPAGVPTAADCVVIPNVTASNNRSPIADVVVAAATIPLPPDLVALSRNVSVRNNGSLTVNADTYLEITQWLNVEPNGEVLIRDSGSLIQIEEYHPINTNNNTGNIRMQRAATGVGNQNYVYWSSPVEDFNVANINTAANELRWEWDPTIDGVHNGTWIAASGPMTVGKGYIVRGLATPPAPIPAENAEFVGRPSNGTITVPITRGTYNLGPYTAVGGGGTMATSVDDNWNLIGNPYPSAISADNFISTNAAQLADNGAIVGTIYLWQRQGTPSAVNNDPFYGDYVYNYMDANYVAYNITGPNPPEFGGSIAAGQSFFIEMDHNTPGVNSTVTFNNSMRNRTLANDNFLRNSERHRIWLDLINHNERAISTLVGYVQDATYDKDVLYDGYNLSESDMKLYSLIMDEKMTIQGRMLPFDAQDQVPLGIVVPANGTYKIGINSMDGLFSNPSQDIYLEDTYLGTIHDLRSSLYVFTSGVGEFNDRFILRYTNETLSTPEEIATSALNIIGVPEYIKVTSGRNQINSVVIYDVLGRVLADYKNIDAFEFKIDLLNLSNGTLIVKATLDNGHQKIKKIVH